MTDIRVKIDELSPYDDLNSDKSRKNLYEVSKNTGTYSSPLYATNGSRKITQEQLREELNIKEYLVNEVIGKTNGDTLEVDKINVLNLTSNATFTLPTASLAYKGKALIIIQSNVNNYKAVINGAAQGPITISDFRDAIIFNCVFDGTSSYDWFAISQDDSKICNRLVVVSSSTYTANANDNIQADGYFLGNVDITIPSAGIAGRCIYIHYPNGIPSSNTVNLLGGFSATLNQSDFILIRDNGSNWEAISTSQNTATTPTLDTVTGAGDTTTNSIEVGGLVVNYPSGSGVAVDITKGGNGEALTVNKTSGSGNVASFTGGTTLISQLDLTTPLADSEIASASTWNGKFNTPTGLTTNTVSRWNGTSYENSYIQELTGTVGGTSGVGATRPYPTFNQSVPPSGTNSAWAGYLKYIDNGVNLGRLYIYSPYTNGQGAGWYEILTNQNTLFSVLATSSPAIGMGLSSVANSTSTLPTNLYTGEIRNLSVGNRFGLSVFQAGGGSGFLKFEDGMMWQQSITSNFFMRDWDEAVIGSTASGGKGGGNTTLRYNTNIRNSQVFFRAMTKSGVTLLIEGYFVVDGIGNITSMDITKPSENTSFFNVAINTTRLEFTGTGIGSGVSFMCQKVATGSWGNEQLIVGKNEKYSADATVKYWAGVGGLALGTSTINASAQLHSQATNKGSLAINVLTTVQRLAITSPATGLQVFDSNLLTLCTFNGGSNIEANWNKYSATSLTGTYTPNTGIAGTTRTTVTVTVTGAVVGQKVVANINDAMRADFVTAGSWFLDMQSYVSATNTVTITFVLSTFTTFGATSSITVNVN